MKHNLDIDSAKGKQSLPLATEDASLRLSDLLRRKHLPLNTRCGQRGLCDGCMIELLAGKLVHAATGNIVEARAEPLSLRGCEYRVAHENGVSLRIPPRSLLAYEPQVVSSFKINIPRAQDPIWQLVDIPAAELQNGKAVAENLCQAIARRTKHRRPVRLSPSVTTKALTAHKADTIRVVLEYREDHWLVAGIEPSDAPRPLGVAIDIGTTTVAAVLVDLANGEILGTAANFNKQMHLGDDVLTRINLCSTDATMLPHLQELVTRDTIAPLLQETLRQANASADQLRCITLAANTTMLHIFAGIDPSSMGIAPFTATFLEHRVLEGHTEPLRTLLGAPRATIHLLPSAAAYVGADLTAGALATGLAYDEGPVLLVDVGTNGEILLKHGDHIFGCATAAGPAFEGAGLTNGVRAADGAVSHIRLEADPFTIKTEKIGKASPVGICGTAYIDFLAQARAIGLLTTTGRFDTETVPGATERLIPWKDYGQAIRIALGSGKTDIVIAESDIANLLQAKAAIAAGILTLLERQHLNPARIKKVYLAGGFGLHLIKEHAIGCGLLPGFEPDQIEVVGNTSLAGAYLALLDCGALDEIARAARKMDVIELNQDPQFEDRYIDQLHLPE